MILSSSFAADLRPLERPKFSVTDISEGVVALELAWETLVEGAILPEVGGVVTPANYVKGQVDIDGLKRSLSVAEMSEADIDV